LEEEPLIGEGDCVKLKTPNVVPWTVQGVVSETQKAIEKVDSRSSKTTGQYMRFSAFLFY
jgi:hypothetical protein